MVFDIDDYLLIRNGEVIAISGNSDFGDVDLKEVAVEVKSCLLYTSDAADE